MSETVTVDTGSYSVSSNTETADEITAALSPDEASAVSEAAKALGKKGGEAAAAARKAKPKEAPEAEADDDEDDEAAELAAAEKAEKEGKLGKPRHDPRARMLQKAREAAEAKREAEKARAEAAQAKAEAARHAAEAESLRAGKSAPAAAAPEPAKPAAAGTGTPKLADFLPNHDTYEAALEEFTDARDAYNRSQWEAEQAERQKATAKDREIRAALDEFGGRMDKARAEDPTFLDRAAPLLRGPDALRPSFTRKDGERLEARHIIMDEALNAENAPALLLHFVEHPDDLQRIKALRSIQDIQVEVRVLSKSLNGHSAAPTAPAPVSVSMARPPVRPVTGSPHTADALRDDASYDEHVRVMNAKERRISR
jgi:hypothetical protein